MIVFYTYIGYGILLYLLVKIKKQYAKTSTNLEQKTYEPEVTLVIPAYNELDHIEQKMANTMQLD